MESVEELCSHIALINDSRVILNGSVGEIRKQFQSNIYEVHFREGNKISFTNALWTGFELIDIIEEGEGSLAKVRMLDGHTPNSLLSALLPHVQITGLNELIPRMNDIFIQVINQSQKQEKIYE